MTPGQPSPPPPAARRGLAPAVLLAGLVVALAALLALGETQGWPWLAAPAARWLADGLGRQVSLDDAAGNSFRLHLLGGIRLDVGRLQIADADWAGARGRNEPADGAPPATALTGTGTGAGAAGPMVDAHGLHLVMRWRDALAWRSGQPLRLQSVVADSLVLRLQRLADGRANWAFGTHAVAGAPAPTLQQLLRITSLRLRSANVHVSDALLALEATASAELNDDAAPAVAGASSSARAASGVAVAAEAGIAGMARRGLSASAQGRYQNLPLQATLRADGGLPWLTDAAAAGGDHHQAAAWPLQLALSVGRANMAFDGQLRDLLSLRDVRGDYRISGPSLAAVAAPLRLTLPTTGAFAMSGRLVRAGHHWSTVVTSASIGRSRLAGEFTFDTPPGAVPKLAGRLHGPLLMLQDLGPAVGAAQPTRAGRVLPEHRFDLPSLRAMDADVLLAIERFDFGTPLLQAAAPLRAHVLLTSGVLRLDALDATLAQGRLRGHIQLDGRQPDALWQVDLAGQGLLLEQWIKPLQRPQQPHQPAAQPYASGRLAAQLQLSGHGRSVADLLASADGRILLHWTQGKVSHLAVEAAGLDLAQALGVLIKGDDALRVDCAVADLQVRAGLVRPTVLLVDTRDSTLWLEGSVSLDSERLALVAHVQPKDWSPLTLRSPLHIDGALARPLLSLDKGVLLQKLLPAALLALVNPLAAVLPLIDAGSTDGAGTANCRAAAARFRLGAGKALEQSGLPAACRTCPTAQAAAVCPRCNPLGGDNVS